MPPLVRLFLVFHPHKFSRRSFCSYSPITNRIPPQSTPLWMEVQQLKLMGLIPRVFTFSPGSARPRPQGNTSRYVGAKWILVCCKHGDHPSEMSSIDCGCFMFQSNIVVLLLKNIVTWDATRCNMLADRYQSITFLTGLFKDIIKHCLYIYQYNNYKSVCL